VSNTNDDADDFDNNNNNDDDDDNNNNNNNNVNNKITFQSKTGLPRRGYRDALFCSCDVDLVDQMTSVH